MVAWQGGALRHTLLHEHLEVVWVPRRPGHGALISFCCELPHGVPVHGQVFQLRFAQGRRLAGLEDCCCTPGVLRCEGGEGQAHGKGVVGVGGGVFEAQVHAGHADADVVHDGPHEGGGVTFVGFRCQLLACNARPGEVCRGEGAGLCCLAAAFDFLWRLSGLAHQQVHVLQVQVQRLLLQLVRVVGRDKQANVPNDSPFHAERHLHAVQGLWSGGAASLRQPHGRSAEARRSSPPP